MGRRRPTPFSALFLYFERGTKLAEDFDHPFQNGKKREFPLPTELTFSRMWLLCAQLHMQKGERP